MNSEELKPYCSEEKTSVKHKDLLIEGGILKSATSSVIRRGLCMVRSEGNFSFLKMRIIHNSMYDLKEDS